MENFEWPPDCTNYKLLLLETTLGVKDPSKSFTRNRVHRLKNKKNIHIVRSILMGCSGVDGYPIHLFASLSKKHRIANEDQD